MKQCREENFDQNFKSMKKKITITEDDRLDILRQLNQKINKENQSKKHRLLSPNTYYFSLAMAFLLIAILVVPPTISFFQQDDQGNSLPSEQPEMLEEQNEIVFDEGHIQLGAVNDLLMEHASTLERGDYIGYTYSINQLYQYLLAIHYKKIELLDESYNYQHNFSTFADLTSAYHENVDFSTVDLVRLQHEDFEIDILLSYLNKETYQLEYLNYNLNYSIHQLTDFSSFEEESFRTALLHGAEIGEDLLVLSITYVEKIEDESAPNNFRLVESEEGVTTISIAKNVPIYLLKDPSTLVLVEWEEVVPHKGLLQLIEDDSGEVIVIKELYLP